MNQPVSEEPQSNTLDEKDLFPIQQEDRTADNPMGTVLNFMGLGLMAELAVAGFDAAANGLDGLQGANVELAGQLGGGVIPDASMYQAPTFTPAPTPDATMDLDNPLSMSMSMPSPPTPSGMS